MYLRHQTYGIDQSCLVSTVKNISGVARHFSFLPPHGAFLGVDEEIQVYGDIREAVSHGGNRLDSSRWFQDLLDAIQNQEITIVSTPSPILYDENTGDVRMLILEDGMLALANPCWDYSLSESVAGHFVDTQD